MRQRSLTHIRSVILAICILVKLVHTGSLVKKSRTRGVKVESLKLPPVVDFAIGKSVLFCRIVHARWWYD